LSLISLEDVSEATWSAIRTKLQKCVCEEPRPSRGINISKSEFHKERPFDGIFKSLRADGQLITETVQVIASSIEEGQPFFVSMNANWPGPWSSANSRNSWIQFDFGNCRVFPEAYSLRFGDAAHMISWVLEGSEDGVGWICVSSVALARAVVVWSGEISREVCGFFKFLKIRQRGQNAEGNDVMSLKAVEFFGRIKGKQ
jgi:hypothetical protein